MLLQQHLILLSSGWCQGDLVVAGLSLFVLLLSNDFLMLHWLDKDRAASQPHHHFMHMFKHPVLSKVSDYLHTCYTLGVTRCTVHTRCVRVLRLWLSILTEYVCAMPRIGRQKEMDVYYPQQDRCKASSWKKGGIPSWPEMTIAMAFCFRLSLLTHSTPVPWQLSRSSSIQVSDAVREERRRRVSQPSSRVMGEGETTKMGARKVESE